MALGALLIACGSSQLLARRPSTPSPGPLSAPGPPESAWSTTDLIGVPVSPHRFHARDEWHRLRPIVAICLRAGVAAVGTTDLELTFAPSGALVRARLPDHVVGTRVEPCIRDAVADATLPRFSAPSYTVRLRFDP